MDIPSPIDFRNIAEAKAWADSAMEKRPCREEFFSVFVNALRSFGRNNLSVLELGSGPGFLAQRILHAMPDITYTMLDHSQAMLDLAIQRLVPLAQNVRFVLADFKTTNWTSALGSFDVVVTMQAVHELRHKRHASKLHTTVHELLRKDGRYLFCDHYVGTGGQTNTELYMTPEEHRIALKNAGFKQIQCLLQKKGLVLYECS